MANQKFKTAGKSQTSPIENTVRKEIRVKIGPARIMQIVFLNGNETKEAHSVKQLVNLSRSAKFVDGKLVANIDRLGNTPRLKVRFNKPGVHRFRVRCEPAEGNSKYTASELSRNAMFYYQQGEKSYNTNADGCLVIPVDDFYVGAAGKDKYIFRASDNNGFSVCTGALETHRLIYLVELRMRSLTSCAKSLSILEHEYAKHNITLLKLRALEVDDMPNIGTSDEEAFKAKARSAYSKSPAVERHPHVIAIAYTGHLAVKKANVKIMKASVQVGPGSSPTLIPVSTQDNPLGFPDMHYLWQGLGPGEGWFVSGRFVKDGSATDAISIPPEKCTAVPVSSASPHRAYVVKVDVSSLPHATGTLELVVNTVDRMRGGLSFPDSNLICVCTQAWWTPIDEKAQNQVIVHELGHKIGMVTDGTGKLPDRTATWYDSSKGHVGHHCSYGLAESQARFDSSADLALSKCVMYGAANRTSSFCIHCSTAVRKVDLSQGWRAF